MSSMAIDFVTTPCIVLRPGTLDEFAPMVREKGIVDALLITDPGLIDAGVVAPVLAKLREAGCRTILFDRVRPDSPEDLVLLAAALARQEGVGAVLGLGGGSAVDSAKIVAYLARNEVDLDSLYGVDLAKGERLLLMLAPTTSGTGFEARPISILTIGSEEKKGIVSQRLLPDVALRDPNTTLGLPPAVTAATGIDAMVHAIEACTSRLRKNPISDLVARQALALLAQNLGRIMQTPRDLQARQAMLLGSCLAGMANAPVAAVHALAYPLVGRNHIPHGLSNALMLMPVLRFNLQAAAHLYDELAAVVGAAPEAGVGGQAEVSSPGWGQLVHGCEGVPHRPREVNIKEDQLDWLAADAIKQTRLLVNNPAEMTETDVAAYTRKHIER